MPLVPYHSNTFEELFRSPDQKAELKLQDGKKTLTLYSEEDCRNIRQYTDATHIFITDKLNHIGGYLFAGFSLKEIFLPPSVQCIEEDAFAGCVNLEAVYGGEGLIKIEADAFVDRDYIKCYGYCGFITEDMIERMPRRMNMPAGYLRQQTPYDWHMALALCDTVWKDAVTNDDYEAMALYSGDPEVRYLVSLRLEDYPCLPLRKMMALPRENISHLERLAEFVCLFYPSLTLHDDGIVDNVKALYREALDRGADDAFCLNESHEAQKIREWLAKDIEQAQDDSFEEVPTDGAPAPSEEPWDDADRWRMLNELEEAGYDEPQNESACNNEGWGELFCGTEGDPFAAFGGFADFDENTEDLLDQLNEEEWDEYEDDYDEDWDEYESDCIGDYEAGDDVD